MYKCYSIKCRNTYHLYYVRYCIQYYIIYNIYSYFLIVLIHYIIFDFVSTCFAFFSVRKAAEPKIRIQVSPGTVQLQGGKIELLPTRSCHPQVECHPRSITSLALLSDT